MSASYSVSPNPAFGCLDLRLDERGLHAHFVKLGRTESIPFASIVRIELRRDVPAQTRARVHYGAGNVLMFPARDAPRFGGFTTDQRVEYSGFVRALLASVVAAGVTPRVTVGSTLIHSVGLVLAAVTSFLVLVLLGALVAGALLPALGVLAQVLVLYGLAWLCMRSGRTRDVSPRDVPPYFLPST